MLGIEWFLFLFPAMHPNIILPFITNPAIAISLYIFALFFSLIPSALFLIPNQSNHINLLPIHKKVKDGRAYEVLSAQSEAIFITILFAITLSPIILYYYPTISAFIPYITIILLLLSIILMMENMKSAIIFALSSLLGLSTYNFILPMLTGFFGLSTLLLSKGEENKQIRRCRMKIKHGQLFITTIYSTLFSLIPCISSAVLLMIRKVREEDFIYLSPSITASYTIFSVFALKALDIKRTGLAAHLSLWKPPILPTIAVILFSSALAFMLFKIVLDPIIRIYQKINKKMILCFSAIMIISINWLLGGIAYLTTLFLSTILGFLCQRWGVKRITCMGSLITPTLIFYVNHI